MAVIPGQDAGMIHGLLPSVNKPIARVICGTAGLRCTNEGLRHLDSIFQLGGNTFDTARVYTNGEAETCLGRWIRSRRLSDRVAVITKGGHPLAGQSRLSEKDLLADVEASLRALGQETIDIFLLHRDDLCIPTAQIIESLNRILKQGKIQAFGASNWSAQRIAEAQEFSEKAGLRGFCLSSPHFSLPEWSHAPWQGCRSLAGRAREAERRWYVTNLLPIVAWSSLAAGFFSGRISAAVDNGTMTAAERHCVDVYGSPANIRRLERVRELAQQKGVTAPQIALAYVLRQPMDTYAVVSCSGAAHFKENRNALSIDLSDAELRWLNLDSEALDQ